MSFSLDASYLDVNSGSPYRKGIAAVAFPELFAEQLQNLAEFGFESFVPGVFFNGLESFVAHAFEDHFADAVGEGGFVFDVLAPAFEDILETVHVEIVF